MNSVGGDDSGYRRRSDTSRSCAGRDDIEPLLVRPRKAWRILDCGNTRGYELLADGELDSFVDGRARWITMESIHSYIERRLAEGVASSTRPGHAGPHPIAVRSVVPATRPIKRRGGQPTHRAARSVALGLQRWHHERRHLHRSPRVAKRRASGSTDAHYTAGGSSLYYNR